MNDVMKIFEHEKFGKVRTLIIKGRPWFVAKDIAEILGYTETAKAVRTHVDSEDKGVSKMDTPGGRQNITIINESGFYSLVLSSKMPAAKEFKHWITSDVLPTIRKYGFYATDDMLEEFLNDPDLAIGVFSKLKEEREKVKQLESENKKLTEKSEYLDLILRSPNAVPITVIAKDYDMSAQEMNGWLRCIGVQYKLRCGTWVLYQTYVGNGYTKSKTIVYDAENCKTRVHTCWTQKGRCFIYEKLKEYGVLPVCERDDDYENPSIPD